MSMFYVSYYRLFCWKTNRKGSDMSYAVVLLPASCFQDGKSSNESSELWFYQSAETNPERNTTFLNFTADHFVFGYQ